LAQAIGCVGWQKLVKSFFFFYQLLQVSNVQMTKHHTSTTDLNLLVTLHFTSLNALVVSHDISRL